MCNELRDKVYASICEVNDIHVGLFDDTAIESMTKYVITDAKLSSSDYDKIEKHVIDWCNMKFIPRARWWSEYHNK